MTAEEIVKEARSWIGTPWHHNARRKKIGVDCVNLPYAVYGFFGLIPHGFLLPEYKRKEDLKKLISVCNKLLVSVSQDEMKPADLIVIDPGEEQPHVGILGDRKSGLSIIHACNSRSCVPPRVIETRLMFSRAMKFVACYRVPGL